MNGDKSDGGTHEEIREDGGREGGRHTYRRNEENDEAGSSASYVPRVVFSEIYGDNGWQSRTTRRNSEARFGSHDPRLEDDHGTEYFRRISVIRDPPVRELNQKFQKHR